MTSFRILLYDDSTLTCLDEFPEGFLAEFETIRGCPSEDASDGYIYDYSKWYDFDSDLKKLSKGFPNVILHVTGNGEEEDDMWEALFYRGMMSHRMAEIVWPDLSSRDNLASIVRNAPADNEGKNEKNDLEIS